jgi:hypothetical protein
MRTLHTPRHIYKTNSFSKWQLLHSTKRTMLQTKKITIMVNVTENSTNAKET